MISCQGRGDKREDGRCPLRFPCEMEGREQAVGPSPRVGERGDSHFMNQHSAARTLRGVCIDGNSTSLYHKRGDSSIG